MKMMILAACLAGLAYAQSSVPRYKQFPAELYTGKMATPKPATKAAKEVKTQIEDGMTARPNFAGRYVITTWSCGTSCLQFAIVNAETGAVYLPPFYVASGMNVGQEKLRDELPLQFKPDSRLLVVVGSRNENGEGVYFYKWDNEKLTLIRSTMERKQKEARTP